MTIHLRNGQLTMTLSSRSCHIFKLLLVFFLVTTTSYYLFFQDRYEVHDVYRVAVTGKGKKRVFVQDLLENEIDGPFDDSALAALCSSKKWTPGLIFKCEAPQGGIGNVRNVFMNCVRYAIEAGATGFIVPEIMVRSPTLADVHTERLVPFNYLFDQPHFVNTLSTACPRMQLYSHQNDLWDKPSTASPVRLLHPQLTSQFHIQAESVMLSAANWTNAFNDLLNSSHPAKFSDSRPVLVSLYTPLLQWPIAYDDPSFIASFGRIFRFREDVRRLAATVLYAMNQKYGLSIDPAAPGIQERKFYGAHLRTAVDAVNAGWTSYEIQADHYIAHAAHNHLPLIYVASGSPADTLRFAHQAGNNSFPIEVTTMSMLLEGTGYESEQNEVSRLTWDQKSIVDYEVMLRASRFGGTWESSFGWNLAMRRHVVMGHGTWVSLDPQAGSALSAGKSESEKISGLSSGSGESAGPGPTPKKTPATKDQPKAKNKAASHPSATEIGSPAGAAVVAGNTKPSRQRPTKAPHPSRPSERRSQVGEERRAARLEEPTGAEEGGEVSKRELPAGQQAFSDAYSIVFGDVTPGNHPGIVFELALWP